MMDQLQFIQWSFALTGLAFFFAFGAICGSFINVLVYRLPKGLNVITPPSACPACGTPLRWRQNIPIFGWLWLRGRCRFCRSPISAEYPLVELAVAVLFSVVYILWFMKPSVATLVGIDPDFWKPDFAMEGLGRMWPMLLIVYGLLGSFIAALLIDARTFTIPLVLPWFATLLAFLVHPIHAFWVARTGGMEIYPFTWTIPVRPGSGIGLALGGGLGIVIAIVLLRLRVLPLSFSDYGEWEATHLKKQEEATQAEQSIAAAGESAPEPSLRIALLRTLFLTGPAVALMFLGFTVGMPQGRELAFGTIGLAVGLLLGLILRRLVPREVGEAEEEPTWVQYPHTRREMVKEILYLCPCIALGCLGWWLTRSEGPLGAWAAGAPLWVLAFSGSVLGYLVGGGIVWIFRIFGSLALGKEAMGLGDVHLMAAAGAALGWIDPLLAFFTAPFLGIGWAILSVFFRQVFHRQGTALPYGPHLAAATMMVLLAKPLFELALSAMIGRSFNIP